MATTTGDPRSREDHDDGRIRRPGRPIDLYRLYLPLRRGWMWVGAAAVLGVVAGVAYVQTAFAPTYVATATVKYTPPPERARSTVAELAAATASLTSRPALEAIHEKMDKKRPPGAYGRRFDAEVQNSTGLIELSASEGTAEGAAKLANAVVDVLLEQRKLRSQSSAQEKLTELDAQIEANEKKLAEARAAYDAFRDEHGIANLTSEQERTITAAADARAAADQVAARKLAAERRIAELEARGTEALDNTSPPADSAELRRARLELAQLRTRLTEEHPQVVSTKERIQQLESRGGSGVGRALAAARAQLAAAERELEPLEQAARLAKERADAFTEVEGEATGLLGAVRLAEANLELLGRERQQLASAAASATTDFSVIARATPPGGPIGDKMKIVSLAGIPFLILLAVIAVLLGRELWGLRVKTPSEVAFWGGGPVVGATTWPREAHGLDALDADLDDRLPNATGTMLIVPSRAEEADLAEEFAAMLNEDWYSPGLVDLSSVSQMDVRQTASVSGGYPALASGGTGAIVPARSYEPSTSVRTPNIDSTGAFQTQQPSVGANAWTGAPSGQALRRAARLADRVLVLASAGKTTFAEVAASGIRLGRTDGVGFLLVDVDPDFEGLPDRVGDIDHFWSATRP